MFLEINGYEFIHDDGQELGKLIEAATTGDVPLNDFIEHFRSAVKPIS